MAPYKIFLTILFLLFSFYAYPQKNIKKIDCITSDITHFWNAYDSVIVNIDRSKKISFLQTLYFDKATIGFKDFIEAKKLTAESLLEVIEKFPKYYASIREQTLEVSNYENAIIDIQNKFLNLYPILKNCKAYFFIGNLQNRGSVKNNNILISTELAAANITAEVSELPDIMKERIQLNRNLLFVLIHEYVHIQQNFSLVDSTSNILTISLKEGSADFIASLLTKEMPPSKYAEFGKKNEKKIWSVFKKEIYNKELQDWLFGGICPIFNISNLGYFIGSAICKSYYNNSIEKQKAIKEIIELDYSNQKKINQFFTNSRYAKQWNR